MKPTQILCTVAALITPTIAAAETDIVFVPQGSGDSILMVRAATGETLRQIDGVEAVHGLSGATGTPYLVAGSYVEVDREDMAAIDQPAGVSADEHEVHHAKPAKPMGPSDAGISILSILDAATGDIVRRVEVPGAVHHTAVSPDGRYAIATHPSGDGISVVDLTDFSLAAYVTTGTMPNYAVFGSDPGRVFVSNAGNGTVSEVDLERGIVLRNIVVGETPEHIALAADAGVMFVADADQGRVYEVALADGVVARSFDIGGEIHGIDLSDDAATVFVAGKEADRLAAIDLASGSVRTAELGPQPYHLTTIPGTGTIFVSSREDPKVWIVDAAALSVRGDFAVDGVGHQMVALR